MPKATLFSPITINNMTLPNRVIMSPMFSNSAGPNGEVTQNTIAHYVDRARSGVGLIMTEHTSVSDYYIHPGNRLQISHDNHVEGMRALVEAVHRENCKIGLQIAHSIHGKGKKPEDLTNEECYQMIDQFVDGARRAVAAGFDCIELHYAHTYTMADFISRRTNKRTDEFGGDIYGRMFIHIEILKRIRELVGPNFPIFVRISAEEFIVDGNTLVQTSIFAKELEKYGIDCLDVSAGVRFDDGGLKGYSDQRGKPTIEYPDGPNVYLAEAMKKIVSVPVVTVGKLGNPDVAKEVIEKGRADLVALARPLIADSLWVKKVKAGREDLIKSCLYCTECLYDRWDPDDHVRCMRYTCQNSCPANVQVPVFVDLAVQGRWEEAYIVNQRENPLVSSCGRICNHLCESHCNRKKIDDAVAIRYVKRKVVDELIRQDKEFPVPQVAPDNGKKVAVIGSGPSGMSCAFYLRKKGYDVTMYEKNEHLGGMLYYGIPEYRLPKDVMMKDYQVLEKMGVKFRTGVTVGKDITIKQLRDEGAEAIYVGIGAQGSRRLGIDGEDGQNVITGLDFLSSVARKSAPDFTDKEIVVIGGGNVAIDVARTALRQHAKTVKMYSLEKRHEMPALDEEVDFAIQDGVIINNGWGPKEILLEDGKVSSVRLKECSTVFVNGRFNPQYNENNTLDVKADYVITAIGQTAVVTDLAAELGPAMNKWGFVAKYDGITALPWLFAGGDCMSKPDSVIKCSNDGKLAAGNIDAYLGGDGMVVDIDTWERKLSHPYSEEPAERSHQRFFTYKELGSNKEAEDVISIEDVINEGNRCLRCDVLKINKL